MKEMKENFAHFDKDNSKSLETREFRAFLLSLGRDIPQVPTEGADHEFERILKRVDQNSSGHVTFDEFVAFSIEEYADAESSTQLIEAFRVIAAGQNYVTAEQLKRELAPNLAEYCIENMSTK